jgi:hypothetical protein
MRGTLRRRFTTVNEAPPGRLPGMLCAAIAAAMVLSFGAVADAQNATDSPSTSSPTEAVTPADPAGAEATTANPSAQATAAEETTEAEEPTEETRDYQLSGRILGTGAFADGDIGQFQQRHRIPENVSGGIDKLHFATEIAEDTQLELDGRAIFDNRDYLLSVSVENEEKGFLRAGFRQFRTWYDGRGGYFPPANASFVEFNPQLGTDRGEAWANGAILLPSHFKLSVGYRYLFRDGTKDSVSWGDASTIGTQRNIVPSRYVIDEKRHQVDVALTRETDTTKVGGAVHYEYSDIDNRRQIVRDPDSPTAERRVTDRDNPKSNLWGTHVFGTRRLLEGKVTVSGAYAYNDIDMDLAGSRIYGAMFNSSFSPFSPNRQQRDEGYFGLDGSSRMKEHVGNVSVSANPFEDVQVLAALRIRGENLDAHSEFTETSVGSGPTHTTALDDLAAFSSQNEISYAQDIEARYKGFENVVLYTRAQWEENDSDLYESEGEQAAPVIDLERSTDTERLRQKYAVGAHYYPIRWMSVSSEYSYRKNQYDYRHDVDSTSNDPASDNRYPAYLDEQTFVTHDVSLRTTLRLPHAVNLVVRYDYMDSTIDTEAEFLDRQESADTRSHVLGATATWNPANWWWTRTGVNYVHSTIDSAADSYDTPVAAFLHSFDNDYVMASFASGVAIDANTDAEFLYTWTSADNYSDVSASTVAYGSRFEENGVRVQVARRFDEHTRVAVGYGFFDNDEAFAGGRYNYAAHLVTTSVEFDY